MGRLKEENVLVLPLDIANFDDHKAAVNHVLSQFKQVGTGNVLLYMTKNKHTGFSLHHVLSFLED